MINECGLLSPSRTSGTKWGHEKDMSSAENGAWQGTSRGLPPVGGNPGCPAAQSEASQKSFFQTNQLGEASVAAPHAGLDFQENVAVSERQRDEKSVEFAPVRQRSVTQNKRPACEQAAIDRVQRRQKSRARLPNAKSDKLAGIAFDYPDQDTGALWAVLHDTFATGDITLTGALLDQFTALSQVDGQHHPSRMKALLASVRAIAPRDETEALLAVQMAAIHDATMRAALCLVVSKELEAYHAISSAINKLARTFTLQMDSLKRYRTTEQSIHVRHTYGEGAGDKNRAVTA